MSDRLNTIFGWILAAGIVALGLSAISSRIYHADRPEAPELAGYEIIAVEPGEEEEAGPSLATLLAQGSAAAGEEVFARCIACHTIAQGGANGTGPNLYGILGLPIGQHAAGFRYSPALSGHGGNWGYEEMDAWLKKPSAYIEGNAMSYPGLSKAEDRANVILYMREMGGGPPLPTPEEEPLDIEAVPESAAVAEADGDPQLEVPIQ